jgi:tRNA nucleotidyltransferase (CCA-adding enzyme)
MPAMDLPAPAQLIAQVRSLRAARPLLGRLPDVPPVYLVGGAVRDLLLGTEPRELDLVVEGDAGALARKLGPATVHDRFGTSTVRLDGYTYDLAGARTETYARPGALPDVTPASLAEDLLRRDFTVNTFAVALGGARAGELQSASGAREDLEARRLRVLHERSFLDDPTRLLRLARYAGRLGFTIEPQTHALALAAVRSDALKTVTGPRIGAELRLLAREDDPIAGVAALRDLGADRGIDPRFGIEDAALARRALELLPAEGRRDLLTLAIAASGVPAGELMELLDRLGFEAVDRSVIATTALRADSVAKALDAAARPSEIASAVGPAPPELVALAGALGPEAQARSWLDEIRHVWLEIDGSDLIAAGVPEGPAIGRGLRAALAAKLDGKISGREDELKRAVQAANATG